MGERDELIEKIHTAVLTDNLTVLRRLTSNVSPGWMSRDFTKAVGRDIIGYCGTTGAVNCARYLVDEYGLDVNGTGNQYPDGFSDDPAIHKAIAGGELEMVEFLANHPETHITQFDESGAPLQFALEKLNYEAADIILKAKASLLDPIPWTGFGQDYQMVAVELACKFNDIKPVEFIVERTPENEVFAKGAGVALYHENDMVFDWMVNKGVDVNEVLADYVQTPDPNPDRIDRNIKRLIKSGASFYDGADYSVPINALQNKDNKNIVELLVKNGLDLNADDGALLNHLLDNKMFSELGRAFANGADVSLLDPVNMRDVIGAHEQNKDIYRVNVGDNKSYLDAIIAMKVFTEGKISHVPTLWEETDHMLTELLRSIRVDDAERLKELLTDADFWKSQYAPDDFLIDKIHHHVIGFCLENDSKECARMAIENNLCDINAYHGALEITSPLHMALSNHANEIAELLLEQPGIKYNAELQSTTPLERALIDRNYDGARMLLNKKPGILSPDNEDSGPIYQQIRAARISTYGDTTPIEIVVDHTPGNIVFPSAGLTVLDRRTVDQDGEAKAINKLFELGLDANELLVGVCGMGAVTDYQDNKRFIKYCLDNGADFSYRDYEGPRLLASNTTKPEKFSAFIDSGLDLNGDNGALLNKVAHECDQGAFDILVKAGCDPELLSDSVKGNVSFEPVDKEINITPSFSP